MRLLLLLVALCVAAGPLAATATPARSATPVEKWVGAFCGAFDDWKTSLGKAQAQATKDLADVKKLVAQVRRGELAKAKRAIRATKSELLSFTSKARTETSRMIGRIDAAGAPPVKHGKEIADALHDALVQVRSTFTTLRGSISKLPTGNVPAFVTAAARFQSLDIGPALDNAFAPLAKYPAPALDRAAAHVAACKSLNG